MPASTERSVLPAPEPASARSGVRLHCGRLVTPGRARLRPRPRGPQLGVSRRSSAAAPGEPDGDSDLDSDWNRDSDWPASSCRS
jgi:hypothetical protein